MNRTNLRWVTVVWLLIFMVTTISVCAQNQNDEWEFTLAPYLLIPGMSGTIGAKGLEAEVNASASDIFSNLQAGFAGYFGGRKGNWGFGTDFMYTALGGSSDRFNVDPTQGVVTFMGTRRLAPGFDLIFGARLNVIQNKIEFKEIAGTELGGTTIEATKRWVDPVVGFNWQTPIGKRMEFSLPVNVGGFHVGSKFALDVYPSLHFKVGKRAWIGGGWRLIYVNYEDGYEDGLAAIGSDSFRFDVTTTGPAIGAVFRF